MPDTVFLLGPDHWDDGVDLHAPVWIAPLLGEEPKPFTPKHLRIAAARRIALASQGDVVGLVMDLPRGPEETPADAFVRLERERGVAAYFLVFPARAKVLGTVFEGGMLVRDTHRGHRPYVAAFYERSFASEDDEGRVAFDGPAAKGHRTDYLRDVARIARHNAFWDSYEELLDLIEVRALGVFGH
jgi:hypothetical protein